jgi:hypothetical protein
MAAFVCRLLNDSEERKSHFDFDLSKFGEGHFEKRKYPWSNVWDNINLSLLAFSLQSSNMVYKEVAYFYESIISGEYRTDTAFTDNNIDYVLWTVQSLDQNSVDDPLVHIAVASRTSKDDTDTVIEFYL